MRHQQSFNTIKLSSATVVNACYNLVQAKLFQDEKAMHIVYSSCGEAVKEEFLMSVKSLFLFALSSIERDPEAAYYHIHVLSDVSLYRDVSFLRPRSHFKVSMHRTYPGAPELFKKCSTERMYLHQHQQFHGIDKVCFLLRDKKVNLAVQPMALSTILTAVKVDLHSRLP